MLYRGHRERIRKHQDIIAEMRDTTVRIDHFIKQLRNGDFDDTQNTQNSDTSRDARHQEGTPLPKRVVVRSH